MYEGLSMHIEKFRENNSYGSSRKLEMHEMISLMQDMIGARKKDCEELLSKLVLHEFTYQHLR